MSIELGKFNTLEIVKAVDFGLYLDGGEHGEILLPARYVPENVLVGDFLTVFLYLDIDERLIATTLTPLIQVGEFALLEVAWVNQFGAFLKWGLMKDLFVPFREQKMKMQVGRSYMVYAYVDEESYRIVASAKLEKFFSKEPPAYQSGDSVDVTIWQKTDLGYKTIVDNKYTGLIYDSQIFKELHIGETMKAYIAQVRPDGKIDLVLQKSGKENIEDFSGTLLQFLKDNGGVTHFNDKSSADEIYQFFGVSKKTFKKAAGDLYKKRLIVIEPDGIRLLS